MVPAPTHFFKNLLTIDFFFYFDKSMSLNRGEDPVMFFGADVTHNICMNGMKVSIASVVGSLDLSYTQYAAKLSEQIHENDNRDSKEIILDLEQMALLLIKSFHDHNKVYPTRIIFYRDGVDEGQFKAIMDQELNALKSACRKLETNYEPFITYIVVQKRHHTRFFANNETEIVSIEKQEKLRIYLLFLFEDRQT
jgi:hypothetical protein